MKQAVIVGFGRFGELLATLCSPDFTVSVIEQDSDRASAAKALGYAVIPIESIPAATFIFLTVPISAMKQTLQTIAPYANDQQVVVDFCSVKVYPTELMKKHLPHCQLLGSHPMFGPDSAKKGLAGLQVAFCPISISSKNEQILRDFWTRHKVSVIDTTPEAHDQDSVYSQAFTYSIAKIILNSSLPDITFKTRSYEALTEIAKLSANDSEQLFHDMLFYNPYFPAMKQKLETAIKKTCDTLDAIEAEQTGL